MYIFHEDWKRYSSRWNTGDYLWIIPYDTCCTEINITQLEPFFVTEEQKNELDDSQEQGVGNLPVVLNDKSDICGYMLFKKRKLIQKYKYKNFYSGIKRTLSVHVVPIKAVCKNDYLGFYKKRVRRIDGAFEIWNGFWKNEVANTAPYLFRDFSLFNFKVSYEPENSVINGDGSGEH